VETPGQGGFPKAAAWITITFQLRHAAPKEKDLAHTSFKALALPTSVAVVLEEGRWGQ
jgi:hypothetical protein